ncbi:MULTISPECIES: hypothetical protein [Mycolicibacterium]|uniref:Uncharacterized protein n=1 Tax=Mycolicibacterium iranicum TaxID=912594 RepID=A0A178LM85_MYCIR|nr:MULTISPECIES: hypothetical protein [Mycolicibacterium]MBV5246899.1 hypothetical protein [Mycolicibacterium sp. PAM1]OAN32059.1 hypothetical protein A4X20_28700 [Mycolicibacterium iranicum]
MAPQKKDPPPLLTLRSTVVFSAAAMAAGVSGIGTYAGTREPLAAAVAGSGVFFAAAAWLDKHVGA